jgi:hypothetical protein
MQNTFATDLHAFLTAHLQAQPEESKEPPKPSPDLTVEILSMLPAADLLPAARHLFLSACKQRQSQAHFE